MAVHHGSEGVVQIGSDTLASITSWSYDRSTDVVDVTSLGDSGKTYKSGLQDGSGSLECYWDEADTTGQQALEDAMADGSNVTLSIYPEGTATGDIFYTGSIAVEGLSMGGGTSDIVTASFTYRGFLERSTVA